jgi:hypothetical protein
VGVSGYCPFKSAEHPERAAHTEHRNDRGDEEETNEEWIRRPLASARSVRRRKGHLLFTVFFSDPVALARHRME